MSSMGVTMHRAGPRDIENNAGTYAPQKLQIVSFEPQDIPSTHDKANDSNWPLISSLLFRPAHPAASCG